MTPEKQKMIDELKRLMAEAELTERWEIRSAIPYGDGQTIFHGRNDAQRTVATWPFHHGKSRQNIALIVALRNAAPELLDRLERAEQARDVMMKAAQSWHDFHHGDSIVQCDALCDALKEAKALTAPEETPQ